MYLESYDGSQRLTIYHSTDQLQTARLTDKTTEQERELTRL